jgi:hypothetical protein
MRCADDAVFHAANERQIAAGQALSFRADDRGAVAACFEPSVDRAVRRTGINLGRSRRLRREAADNEAFPGPTRKGEAGVEHERRVLAASTRWT